MALDLLDAPLRLTWDLCPENGPQISTEQTLAIADALVDAGVFFLLLDQAPLRHPGIHALLERLAAGGCQTGLVVGDHPDERAELEHLDSPVNLLVDAGPWLERTKGLEALEAFIGELRQLKRPLSLFWCPGSGQLGFLPPLLALCQRLGLPRFKLPNTRIDATADPVAPAGLLQAQDIEELAARLAETPLDQGDVALEVHDLFLWELLFPHGGGERSEYGGCQAANSLGHIASNGDLWPCSSWPRKLGSLLEAELADLWESVERFRVRQDAERPPHDCAGCRDYAICFGGCRGLALSCRNDGDERDLLCRGPREEQAD